MTSPVIILRFVNRTPTSKNVFNGEKQSLKLSVYIHIDRLNCEKLLGEL